MSDSQIVPENWRGLDCGLWAVCGQSLGRRLSISVGTYATVFQAEVQAILACVYEIQTQIRQEKYYTGSFKKI